MNLKTIGGTKLEFLSFSNNKGLIWARITKLEVNNHILISDLDEESKLKLEEFKNEQK